MAAAPAASVPKACNGWGETMAAYRFFDNDSVEWQAIMQPHWANGTADDGANRGAVSLNASGKYSQASSNVLARKDVDVTAKSQ